ncbi:hypothetical protein DITRI_Ditri18aG0049600 [Diplodiscus trichospermus]
MLGEVLSAYGKVVDAFIPFHVSKPTTFAFVRYRYESEMEKAIILGMNRRIHGLIIKDRGKGAIRSSELNFDKEKDGRSYKEVVIRVSDDKRKEKEKSLMKSVVESSDRNAVQREEDNFFEVNYNVDISKEELEWLNRSVIGRLQEDMIVKLASNLVREVGFNCSISLLGDVSVCLTFSSKKEKLAFMDKATFVVESCLEMWEEWNHATTQKEFDCNNGIWETTGCLGECAEVADNLVESRNVCENQWALQIVNCTRLETCLGSKINVDGLIWSENNEGGMLEDGQLKGLAVVTLINYTEYGLNINKRSTGVGKRKKKQRKNVIRIIREEKDLQSEFSDQSLSDADTEHRNAMIMKEAKILWG